MRNFFVFLLLGWLIPAHFLKAAEIPAPVFPETFKGLWESIRQEEMRVIRMDCKNEKETFLIIARHPQGLWIYQLKEFEFKEDRIKMVFMTEDGQITARFEGAGKFNETEGVLRGQLTITPDLEKQSTPDLEFVRLPKDYKDEFEPEVQLPKRESVVERGKKV